MRAKRGQSAIQPGALRIDQLLWRLRFSKSRGLAQRFIRDKPVRLNGRRVERASTLVRADDIVTMPRGDLAIAMRIVAIPARRGPAVEAQGCYEILQ